MIGNSWDKILKDEFDKGYFKKLMNFIEEEYKNEIIYPYYPHIFNALKLTDYENIKVVILGQDPYHGVGQAHGLCFSVQNGIALPPSLRNIYKEIKNDLDIDMPKNGNLEHWAKQGILLLNAVLTVKKDLAASHKDKGWEVFTDEIIKLVAKKDEPIVFILWGNYAKNKKKFITNPKHLVIESAHPSPLSASRGFYGSKPFSKTNEFLKENNLEEIRWKKND